MGGFGSGKRAIRDTTDGYCALDVRLLQRNGWLKPGLSYSLTWNRCGEPLGNIRMRVTDGAVVLAYQYRKDGGEWQAMEYPVSLDWTDCTYGGKRAWFRCPAEGCGRRVALLYIGSAGIFACRHCYRLACPVEHENAYERAARRVNRIRERLGWDAGVLSPKGGKPERMHWRTFERLEAEHDRLRLLALLLPGLNALETPTTRRKPVR